MTCNHVSYIDAEEEEQGNDWLFTVISDIVSAHNATIDSVYSVMEAQNLEMQAYLLPDEPNWIYPNEVDKTTCIIGEFTELHGINNFLQLIRSRFITSLSDTSTEDPGAHAIHQLKEPIAKFQLAQLEQDIIATFIAGKPLIHNESPSQLRTLFKFKSSDKGTDRIPSNLIDLTLDIDDMTEKLPEEYKVSMEDTLQKHFEYQFHSADYHTVLQIITGLKTVLGHLIKDAKPETQNVSQFVRTLYAESVDDDALLKQIGIEQLAPTQLACLRDLPLRSTLSCLLMFTDWVNIGLYDFCTLPFTLKAHMLAMDTEFVENELITTWKGSIWDLFENIEELIEILKHTENDITINVNEYPLKSIVEYLTDYNMYSEKNHLIKHTVPKTVLLKHYVFFRLALRRLKTKVEDELEGSTSGTMQLKCWQEFIEIPWDAYLPSGSFTYNAVTQLYGFQEGYNEGDLADDFFNEPDNLTEKDWSTDIEMKHVEEGVENFNHYEAYKKAIEGGLSLTLRYLKFLFFGPPRSGKTSTRRRLIGEIVNLHQLGVHSISTGVAEANDVIIKKLTSEPAAIEGSQWRSLKKSTEDVKLDNIYSEGDFSYLAQLFYRLIYKNTTPGATGSEPVQDNSASHHLAAKGGQTQDLSDLSITPASTTDHKVEGTELNKEDAKVNHDLTDTKEDAKVDHDLTDTKEDAKVDHLTDTEGIEIKNAFEKLTTILQSDSPEDLKRLLEELTMINMTDVGGQPAFLDMLPALTIGPALYFLFFRLDQELGKHYPVRFCPAENKEDITLESSYCIKEVLHQCLASIACFSCHQRASSAKKPQVASSGALLFGTYKDQVDDSKISQIEHELEKDFEETKLHEEGLLLKSSRGKMIITIDNMFGTDESEMSVIRKDIEGIIKSYFPATEIPVSWLMFRIILHLLNKPVVSLAQCVEIAKQLSMPSPVQEALWFFHRDIGSLMYYSNIPSMENIVICDPQVIFDSISKLIIDKFKCSNRALKPREVKEFYQKGQFSLSHISDTTECQQSGYLKLNQLMDLLKDLNILAEVKQPEEGNQAEPKFIMPAVMKYASESELVSLSITSEKQASPLIIHFEGGFVPFGVFCAGMAHLIAHQDSMSPKWQLCNNQVRKNKVKFLIDGAFFAILVSRPQHITVCVERHPKARCKSTLEVICSAVRQTIVGTLETVISKMKYKPYETLLLSSKQPFELAFTCSCLDDSHGDHVMTLTEDESGRHAMCLKSDIVLDLEDRHLIWFKTQDENSMSDLKSSASFASQPLDEAADMKCPVCLKIQVDPCTLQCGHTLCQLCLARMWNRNKKSCPVCKETWQVFPAITYSYRANIESSYGHQVTQIRTQYTEEDKELIEGFLEAKRIFDLESQSHAQKFVIKKELKGEDLLDILSLRTFSKHLNNEQLSLWLSDHPLLMGIEYQHDIGKLKEAKINGNILLSLDKGSLDQFGLSDGFQIPLIKIIKDLRKHQQLLDAKIQPQLAKQKSPAIDITSATTVQHQPTSSITGQQIQNVKTDEVDGNAATETTSAQPTESIETEIEETDTTQSISAQPTEHVMWKLPGIEECSEKSVVVHSSHGQLVEWNGLKLHIHEGSLPEGVHQCKIDIKASLAGQYEIPENSHLVSAIFWLRCEPQCKFIKPITVEIQHCNTKQNLSRLKIVRAFCSQKHLPYNFKPLGGRFNADTSYGVIEVTSFSGFGVIEESPVSERLYYSQLFYRSHHSHQHVHEIHIIFTWNTEAHTNYVSEKYPVDGFHAGYYKVIELDGNVIKVGLEKAKWTKVMDDQWEIHPAQPMVTKAELDDFKLGRRIPNCVIEARPLCDNFPQFLHEIILNGIKPPHHELVLSYMPSRRAYSSGTVQQPQVPAVAAQPQVDTCPQPLTFSEDMSNEQLALWLSSHPKLKGTDYQQDISKLKDARINGFGFLSLNENRLQPFGLSFGFLLPLINIIEDVKRSHQPPDIERLPSQQRSPARTRASSSMFKEILSGSEATRQPQSPVTVQWQVDVHPQPLTFSEDMSNEQLALWLSNHPKLRGTDYQQDISKLKDARINGYGFLSLNENRLQPFGLSFGFLLPLINIIEDLKTSPQQPPDSERLPSQQQSPASSVATPTTQPQSTSPASRQQTRHETMRQPQAPAIVQPQVDVSLQPLTFSKDMSNEQLAQWLSNHPNLTGTDYHEDIGKLRDARINGYGFLSLNESRLERFGVSFGFQIPLMNIIEDLKTSQQPDSERLPSQQQSPASSVATPTTQPQPTSSAARQQTNIDKVLTLKQLTLLKYTEKGEKKKLNIIEGARHKWKDIASLICDDPNKLSTLEQQYQSKPQECLRQIFIDDFINKEPQDYSQDWSGLIELLEDVDLKALAERVKHALSCT